MIVVCTIVVISPECWQLMEYVHSRLVLKVLNNLVKSNEKEMFGNGSVNREFEDSPRGWPGN